MEKKFVHLRIHTEFSLSDGLIRIPALIAASESLGLPAAAITDLSNLYATVKFYQAAMAGGVKPIIGADLCLVNETAAHTPYRITVLCQNNLGYQNLLKLVSLGFLKGQVEGKPTITHDWLNSYSDGLITLLGQESDLGQALLRQDQKQIKNLCDYWLTLFPQRLYLEVKRIGQSQENEFIKKVALLAEKKLIPLVATNDVRFHLREDFEAHEARVCIQESWILNDPNRPRKYTEQQYLRSAAEMHALFHDLPEAILNTIEIAKRCNVTFSLHQNRLPHFKVPEGFTTESYLSDIAKKGLDLRLATIFSSGEDNTFEKQIAYDERLNRELAVINNMGFAGYFLIVADFTKWAKENGIPVGPGRGSGPGSLVAFALNITDLDPLALGLLFERFLNPERVSMPDFDIDFCMEGRDRVIEYVMKTHGSESVSHIITYGTMAAKAVVRDVGRVLGLGYGFVDKIAKLIPFELGMTLEKALIQEPLLKERVEKEEEVRTLIELARKLEGVVRNVGKHAGGIVIAPGKLIDFVPLYCEPNECAHPVTQFDKDDVEAVGLVKFDFLGLKTLTIINRALTIINQKRREEQSEPIDITLIPLDDKKTFALLKDHQTTAVFQLESHGMRDLIKRLQPDCFEDLIALVALFRPGPLQAGMVEDFINRKHGRAKVVYSHPDLEAILSPTYGVIVYQEQVMKIAQVLAGYTLGAADILRKAMGKKKPEEMAKQRKIFCEGAKVRGVAKEVANSIYDLMEKFAGYGFNKSHSASYALIAYQTAWLKSHYPAAFMAAVLSSEMDRTEKIITLLEECKALQLHVSPPDINRSEYFFKVIDDRHLLYGLGAIKGVGTSAIENMIQARNEQGEFNSLFNFCQRLDLRKVNRRVIEALIKSGSFDGWNKHRALLIQNVNLALQQAEQNSQDRSTGQHDLLCFTEIKQDPHYVDAVIWNEETRLANEKETLGFYLTGHPLTKYLPEFVHFTSSRISELKGTEQTIRIAGIITALRTRQTKKGDRMAILTLDDGTAHIDGVCFSDTYNKYRHLLIEDQILIVEGDVSIDEFNNGLRIMAKDFYTLDQARERFAKALQINVPASFSFNGSFLQKVLEPHLGGGCHIVMRYIRNNIQADIKLAKRWAIKPTTALLQAIDEHFSVECSELKYRD
ncbi:MAG: DNA polymerase III subunit alpha [Gammaproteobacteria bacterium]|nr:DNA polymerase III subunit alpha [Gammaproteobacteria bacterium]